jgi:phospholipid transport system substrate-binding protein
MTSFSHHAFVMKSAPVICLRAGEMGNCPLIWLRHPERIRAKRGMRRKEWIMKSLLYAVLSLLILSQTAVADDKSAAEEVLKGKLEAVISVLQKKELEQEAKKKEIIEIVTPVFDFSLMAKLTLGRKFWPGLAEEKREKFTELFIKRLKESYLEKMTRYTDEKIVYNAPVQVKKRVHIPTDLISKDNKISMLYKLYRSKHNWKIYDIEIEGVSVITTYRSQFDDVLSKGTIDDLLKKLEESENNRPVNSTTH